MRVWKKVVHHPNLDNYEWIEFEAGVELSDADLLPGETAEDALNRADEIVTTHLEADLREVLRITANDKTYVDHMVPQEELPRRTALKRHTRRTG